MCLFVVVFVFCLFQVENFQSTAKSCVMVISRRLEIVSDLGNMRKAASQKSNSYEEKQQTKTKYL